MHESLRPWRAAGLSHILLDVPVASLGPPVGAESMDAPLPPPAKAARKEAADALWAAPAPGAAAPGATSAAEAIHTASPLPARETGRIRERDLPSASPEDWPEPWRTAFTKARRAPLVWSYHELGLDLAGTGSPDRGNFFRKLIAELGLPGGTSTFWPTAVPVTDPETGARALQPDAAVYHEGLRRLAARAVVLLGRQSLVDSEYAALPLFEQRIDAGRLIVHVPGLDQLLRDHQQARVTLSFLQASLSFLL